MEGQQVLIISLLSGQVNKRPSVSRCCQFGAAFSDSDSDSNEVFLQSVLHCSSPIQWSPQRIDCNKNQDLEQNLQEMQQIHPQINRIVPNRVYEVDTILAGIQSQLPTQKPDLEQAQALTPRLKKRHDYKKVNKKGF